MKFTPGPWTKGYGDGVTGPTTPSVAGACCGGRCQPYTIVSKNRETIAIIPQQEDGIMDANARLIAAAPTMYEELKEICEWCHDIAESALCEGCKTGEILAKVEGK